MTHMLWSLACVFLTALGFRRGCTYAAKVIGRYVEGQDRLRASRVHERIQPTYDAILGFAVELDILEQTLRHFSVKPRTAADLKQEMRKCGCERCQFMLAFGCTTDMKDHSVN